MDIGQMKLFWVTIKNQVLRLKKCSKNSEIFSMSDRFG